MNDNKDYSIDDILAEFSSFSDNMISGGAPQESQKAEPVSKPQPPVKPQAAPKAGAPADPFKDIFDMGVQDFAPQPAAPKAPPAQPVSPRRPASAPPAARHARPAEPAEQNIQRRHVRPAQEPAEQRHVRPQQPVQQRHTRPAPQSPEERHVRHQVPENDGETQVRRPKRKIERPAPVKVNEEPRKENRGLAAILSIIFAVIGIFALSWVVRNVHPDSGTVTTTSVKSQMNLVEKFDNYANNAASDALSDLTYIPKIYTIGEDVNVAPKPNPNNFGSTTDPQEVMKVIESAAALLDGQEVAFNPDAKFIPGSEIRYYLDDTILAITWKEDIDGKCCSCAEVKIAHGSQIRRKVAGDSYSVGKRYYASDMAKECNSIVAINGDFYDFRNIGITVFQRQLFRFAPDKLDSCHITSSGDLLFSYAGELYDEEYTKQFIKDNDVLFTLSFGPILADNGELREVSSYPIGEINTTYSRAAIGQFDKLHYVLMTVNYDVGYTVAATLNQVGKFLFDKGCPKVYGLDGGQTSVLMMNGDLVNHVDYGYERTMSDIIYFATAVPEEEAAQ